MTDRDFILWLKGFAQAAHSYNITPKQWEDLKETLSRVNTDVEPSRSSKYSIESNQNTSSTATPKLLLND